MNSTPLCEANGFSLIETLVATLILATALMTLAQVLLVASSATDDAGRVTWAAILAAQKVEDLRAASATAFEGGGSDAPARGFTRTWSFGPLPSDPDHVVVIDVLVRTFRSRAELVALRSVAR